MEEKYKVLSSNPELLSLCESINEMVRKREALMEQLPSKYAVKDIEGKIFQEQLKLRKLIYNRLHDDEDEKMLPESLDTNISGKDAAADEEAPAIPPSPISMESLFSKDPIEEVYYYTIIAKDLARKEMPDLVGAYPNHFYYAIICIEAEDGQYVKIVQNEDGQMPYYTLLDQSERQEERIRIMDSFLEELPGRYIHAKYEDLFGE